MSCRTSGKKKKSLHFFIKAATSPLDLFIYTLIYSLLTAKLWKLLSGAGCCSTAIALYAYVLLVLHPPWSVCVYVVLCMMHTTPQELHTRVNMLMQHLTRWCICGKWSALTCPNRLWCSVSKVIVKLSLPQFFRNVCRVAKRSPSGHWKMWG